MSKRILQQNNKFLFLVCFGPPQQINPNPMPVGNGFGFTIYYSNNW